MLVDSQVWNRLLQDSQDRLHLTYNILTPVGLLLLSFFLSLSIYCLALAFEHYRQVYIVHSGLQNESLQATISKLP